MSQFKGRLGIVQRVLPRYRAAFFDQLAEQVKGGLEVFAGQPRPSEAIASAEKLSRAEWQRAKNVHLLGGRLYFCYQRGLVQWLEQWNPDTLVVEANPRYLSTPAAIRWMHARQRPVIGWGLGAPRASGAWRLQRRRQFLQQFDALISYTPHGAAEYRAEGVSAQRVFVAPNAVTPRPAGPPPKRSFSQPLTLLYVGRLQKRKRVDVLLRACASLPKVARPRLRIVGDGPERGKLERLARQIYPEAEFSGALFGEQLAAAFTTADLLTLPGSGGLAIQQAMAYGLPIVAADVYISQEDMVRPENGWLVLPGNVNAFATALSAALSEPERLRHMGEASFRLVQQEFNLENMVQGFLAALNSVVA